MTQFNGVFFGIFSVTNTPYHIIWHCIFTAPRSKSWSDILILVGLFTIPVCNVKLERIFTKLKYIKKKFCTRLTGKFSSYSRRRPFRETLDAFPVINLWVKGKSETPSSSSAKTIQETNIY